MSDHTNIEWTDATWNPITGCSVVSPGCTNCYAMRLAGTRLQHHPSRAGLTRETKAGSVWTGEVRLNEQWLKQPLSWRRPRRIFVCAHGDLFAEGVPDEWIDKVFAVMALASQHVFQVLTKRPERMRAYLNGDRYATGHASERIGFRAMEMAEARRVAGGGNIASALIHGPTPDHPSVAFPRPEIWPLPNVWLGTSVEDQRRADERIPLLLDTLAAVRWISAEPLLGAVDLTRICIVPKLTGFMRAGIHVNALYGRYVESGMPYVGAWDVDGAYPADALPRRLDWVVAGGESGPDARPMHPDWARSLRDQCAAAGVPFFFKQWGTHVPVGYIDRGPATDPNEFAWERVGKKAAGRELDGRTHDEMPDAPR